MKIKIQASNSKSALSRIKIHKNSGLMPVIFHNTANDKKYRLYLTPNLMLDDVYRLLVDLNIIIKPPEYFIWKMCFDDNELDFAKSLSDNHIHSEVQVDLYCVECSYDVPNINLTIINGIGGAKCDIDVPMDATIGDVIVGLINEGFLDADIRISPTVLYNMDADDGISSGVKYDNRSKTVYDYGLKDGQKLVAVTESADGYGVLITIRLQDSSEIEICDVQCLDYEELFEEIAKQISLYYFPVSKIDMSFYYLYDRLHNKMIIRGRKEVPLYIAEMPKPSEVYARLKEPLLLLRQVVEEL